MVDTNARDEFEKEVKNKDVLCAEICFLDRYRPAKNRRFYLRKGYTPHEYEEFLQKIDHNYNSNIHDKELDGVVWLTDGSWIEREEYLEIVGWGHCEAPRIPPECESPGAKSAGKTE